MLLAASTAGAQPTEPAYADVQAIFGERCTLCHSGEQPPLGLGLDSFESVMSGSVNGPVVVPGDPDGSELVRRIRGTSTPRMPLTGPPYLSDAEIGTVAAWIAAGAQGPTTAPNPAHSPSDAAGEDNPVDPVAEPGTFADVQAILGQRCVSCHSAGGVMGAPPEGLVLTSWEAMVAGGERAVVVPGVPGASELLRRIEGWSLPRMPFDGPPYLGDEQIESVRRWIERGAPGPDGRPAAVPVGAEVRLGGTLTGRWEIDGFPLAVTGDTRIDDHPTVGSYVEARGVVTAEGGVRATRIRTR